MAKYVKLEELPKLLNTPPRTGHYSEVVTDTEYRKRTGHQLRDQPTGLWLQEIAMGRTIIPRHTANKRHVHMSAEAAMFIVRGTMTQILGPEAKIIKCPPGTFVFAPGASSTAWPKKTERKRLSLSLLMEECPQKRLPKSDSLMTKIITNHLLDGTVKIKDFLSIREWFRSLAERR